MSYSSSLFISVNRNIIVYSSCCHMYTMQSHNHPIAPDAATPNHVVQSHSSPVLSRSNLQLCWAANTTTALQPGSRCVPHPSIAITARQCTPAKPTRLELLIY